MILSKTFDFSVLPDDCTEFEFSLEFDIYDGSPGRYVGPPENCYEAEEAQADLVSDNFEQQLEACLANVKQAALRWYNDNKVARTWEAEALEEASSSKSERISAAVEEAASFAREEVLFCKKGY